MTDNNLIICHMTRSEVKVMRHHDLEC